MPPLFCQLLRSTALFCCWCSTASFSGSINAFNQGTHIKVSTCAGYHWWGHRSYCAPGYGQFSGQCHAYDSTRSSAESPSFTVGRSAYKYLHPG